MTATMTTSRSFMPGSFTAGTDHRYNHTTYNNVFQPPQSSPRTIRRDSKSNYRTNSSIPRPTSTPRTSYSRAQSPGYDNSSVRKRPRLDVYQHGSPRSNHTAHTSSNFSADTNYDHSSSAGLNDSTYSLDLDIASPAPLIDTSYRFAGGLQTSNTSFEPGPDELSDREAEKDWRVNRYNKHNRSLSDLRKNLAESEGSVSYVGEDGTFHKVSSPKAPSMWNGSGLKRSFEHDDSRSVNRQQQLYSISGWNIRSTAWALTGGLAAKAINFCLTSAFGGFTAGGGTTYKMNVEKPESRNDKMDLDEKIPRRDAYSSHHTDQPRSGEIPGGFPEDLDSRNHTDQDSVNTRSTGSVYTPTASGRTMSDQSTLRNGWHLVDQPDYLEEDRPGSPVRKKSRASVADTSRRSDNYRTSTNSNLPQSTHTSSISGASYASPRARTSTSTIPTKSHHRTSSTNSQNSTRTSSPERRIHHHSRPAPLLSPRRSTNSRPGSGSLLLNPPPLPSSPSNRLSTSTATNTTTASPISPEVKQYARRIQKKEKIQDETVKRLNAQMKEMIRQGREALGTTYKIEVHGDGVDGGRGGGNGNVDEGFFDDSDNDDYDVGGNGNGNGNVGYWR